MHSVIAYTFSFLSEKVWPITYSLSRSYYRVCPSVVSRTFIKTFLNFISGMEDDVIVEFIFNQLEAKDPDPRKMQINLTGFLNGKNARIFMGELWKLLDSAQKTTSGIPQELIDKKKEEMKSKSDDDRIRTSLRKLGKFK